MKNAQILTPVVTAFDQTGNIDIKANQKIYEHLIHGGVDGIVVMGSTGEFFSLSKEQRCNTDFNWNRRDECGRNGNAFQLCT